MSKVLKLCSTAAPTLTTTTSKKIATATRTSKCIDCGWSYTLCVGAEAESRQTGVYVSASAVNPGLTNEQRYQAMLRISEALSECREHDEVARVLADCLSEFLQFEHLDFVVFKGDYWLGLAREYP
jgi:succinate dehydrogenase/fumarate reductase-like Fe-S protein